MGANMLRIKVVATMILFLTLPVISAFSPLCFPAEILSGEQKRVDFLAAYNGMRADKRLAAIGKLDGCKELRSIETLYFVSWRDADPEVRSRAFSTMVHCDDAYGYTAYLAANSFKRENDLGVKVEKAVEMGSLHYKWEALNELVGFLRTLRWKYWAWNWYGHSGGYIASGNPPAVPGETPRIKDEGSGYGREPLRWRSENELIALIAGVINRLSGTRVESRPRIDQEIVKWWERKSDLWAEYDRELRATTIVKPKVLQFKNLNDAPDEDDEIQPGKDTIFGKNVRTLLYMREDGLQPGKDTLLEQPLGHNKPIDRDE